MMFIDLKDTELNKDDLLHAYSFIHNCISSKNSEVFHQHILNLTNFLGFEYVLYGYMFTTYTNRHDAVVVNLTNPKDWMREYFSLQANNPLIDEIERQYSTGKNIGYSVWDKYDWELSKAQQTHIARRRKLGLDFGCSAFATSTKKNFSIILSVASKTTIPDERTKAIARLIINPLLITKKRLIMKDLVDSLTEKEKEVAAQLMSGNSYKVIAQHIGVSENTVKFHLKNIYSKLKVKNRQQVAAILLAEHYLGF